MTEPCFRLVRPAVCHCAGCPICHCAWLPCLSLCLAALYVCHYAWLFCLSLCLVALPVTVFGCRVCLSLCLVVLSVTVPGCLVCLSLCLVALSVCHSAWLFCLSLCLAALFVTVPGCPVCHCLAALCVCHCALLFCHCAWLPCVSVTVPGCSVCHCAWLGMSPPTLRPGCCCVPVGGSALLTSLLQGKCESSLLSGLEQTRPAVWFGLPNVCRSCLGASAAPPLETLWSGKKLSLANPLPLGSGGAWSHLTHCPGKLEGIPGSVSENPACCTTLYTVESEAQGTG